MIHKPVNKILLALQFWNGDREAAMKLARFIADLQDGKNTLADFLFVSRFDCRHDKPTVDYISRKFTTHFFTSRARGTGWPHGCNSLWFSVMSFACDMIAAKKLPPYKAILTFEGDCVPMAPHWINILSRAWDEEEARHSTFVFGAQIQAPRLHINGNAMFSGNPAFLNWVTRQVGGVSPNGGWDYLLYPDFNRWGAHNCPMMKSFWGMKTCPSEVFNNEIENGTIFLHGVKDDSALKLSRKKFLG